jgi:hypothetical protein
MKGFLRAARMLVTSCFLRPLWRCLMMYGALHATPIPTDPIHLVFGIERFGYFARLPEGFVGPCAGHPERVNPEVPLTETELLLALEVWSVQRPRRHSPYWLPRPCRGRSGR